MGVTPKPPAARLWHSYFYISFEDSHELTSERAQQKRDEHFHKSAAEA